MTPDLFSDNPLLGTKAEGGAKPGDSLAVDIEQITSPTIIRRETAQAKHRRLMRGENARNAIRGIRKNEEIFGFTKGQFSLIDLILAALEQTGPADIDICTWTANTTDVGQVDRFIKSGLVNRARFVIDLSSQRRKPAFVAAIREAFGDEALRVTQIHAKFVTIRNAEWDLVLRTSMNLNQNPRFEDFTIGHDPALADFLQAIVNDLFRRPQSHGSGESTWTETRSTFRRI